MPVQRTWLSYKDTKSLAQKVLGVRVSDTAYTAFVSRLRMQLYNYYTNILEFNDAYKGQVGRETTGRELGHFVNSITGFYYQRAKLGESIPKREEL